MILIKQRQAQLTPAAAQWITDPENHMYLYGDEFCDEYSGEDLISRWEYKFTFARARCTPDDGDLRKFAVTCDLTIKKPPYFREKSEKPRDFISWCPEEYVCQDWDYKNIDEVDKQDVHCIPQAQVNLEKLHIAEAVPGSHGKLHCSRDELVPSTSHVAGSSRGLNLIVTEKVIWPNGSDYTAPILLIHDKTLPFGFDRVFKRNAHFATTDLLVRSTGRDQVQQRKLHFCVELIPGRREFWVVLMYSWWRATGRKGHVADLNNDAQE